MRTTPTKSEPLETEAISATILVMHAVSQLMTDRDISQSAPVVVQRATGHERIETYGNSSPIIHSVFHNSVEKLGAQNAVSVLFATYLPD